MYFYHLIEILKYAPHRSCGAYSRAALINHSAPCAALNRGRRLFGGGAYSSKYGNGDDAHSRHRRLGFGLRSGTDCWTYAVLFDFPEKHRLGCAAEAKSAS